MSLFLIFGSFEYLFDFCLQLGAKVKSYNLDGRQFWRVMRGLQREQKLDNIDHVVMNLPAIAIEFIGTAFRQLVHVSANTNFESSVEVELSLAFVHECLVELSFCHKTRSDAFCGTYTETELAEMKQKSIPMPRIHTYCFSGAIDTRADVIQVLLETCVGELNQSHEFHFH